MEKPIVNQLCMRCIISGKVQGVWFRASAKQEAEKLMIRGWARNLHDGRVEVFACGDEKQLELFSRWLQQGPQHAKVLEFRREDLDWQECEGFSIL